MRLKQAKSIKLENWNYGLWWLDASFHAQKKTKTWTFRESKLLRYWKRLRVFIFQFRLCMIVLSANVYQAPSSNSHHRPPLLFHFLSPHACTKQFQTRWKNTQEVARFEWRKQATCNTHSKLVFWEAPTVYKTRIEFASSKWEFQSSSLYFFSFILAAFHSRNLLLFYSAQYILVFHRHTYTLCFHSLDRSSRLFIACSFLNSRTSYPPITHSTFFLFFWYSLSSPGLPAAHINKTQHHPTIHIKARIKLEVVASKRAYIEGIPASTERDTESFLYTHFYNKTVFVRKQSGEKPIPAKKQLKTRIKVHKNVFYVMVKLKAWPFSLWGSN